LGSGDLAAADFLTSHIAISAIRKVFRVGDSRDALSATRMLSLSHGLGAAQIGGKGADGGQKGSKACQSKLVGKIHNKLSIQEKKPKVIGLGR
jgi:hypothetical protein